MKCYLCKDNKFSLNKRVGLPCEESIVYEDEYLYIMPDIAPLVCGHFLIVSKEHITCFAKASNNILVSVSKAKDYLKKSVFANKQVLFFEHGAMVEHTAGSCIDHAHIHIIPIIKDLDINRIDSFINYNEYTKESKIIADKNSYQYILDKQHPYLYYELENEKWLYLVGKLPSQFFRMMIGSFLSVQYNWKITYKYYTTQKLFIKSMNLFHKNDTLLNLGEKSIVKDIIYKIFPYLEKKHDDASIIDVSNDAKLIVSTDPCPEPVVCQFDIKNEYFYYGWMSVVINYSDMAAMGVNPVGILLSTIMPNDMTINEYKTFLNGVKSAIDKLGGELLGGNIKEGPVLNITGTSFGRTNKTNNVLTRKGMKKDDLICVAGDMGMFWLAILQLLDGKSLDELDDYVRQFLCMPYPKLGQSSLLAQSGVITSCMDSSDGIIGALYELAEINNLTISLDDKLLIPNQLLKTYCSNNSVDFRNLMLSWGGWELVFSCSENDIEIVFKLFESRNYKYQIIGKAEKKQTYPVILDSGGERYFIKDFSSKRFDKSSYFSYGINAYIKVLKEKQIENIK